ncbi:Nitrilase/cyanide hydratase and apolipoprotein N-acyltransferase [Methanospirillum hungatei JF-1]|jgi:predicted amidohydrolase|uniref:Nitrilase/cyanide hydratase and apolipoprotein N-acyltransferase n=1 Tax=Methanospirillum hungatei JF-1 (strain ATCC 27890 / DSM 864 / NBRC 100397 / JF-1) TaxID=323259 RepID=Q2FQV1_METHJ|nr:carbon-nitrogen hydrolase family protein [Methanospirillum hungatei]ABD40733.1 Nitrilase/cyanide hydratase and apolipoprotein N-acyltransferase [Methanospirillum hungatei JF-1]MBP9009655.1 carbon-nitrogen hydrolase family protein [Methanospirillum sp.]
MILCAAQISPCWNDPESGLKKMRQYAAEAVEGDAELIAFPEQILTGWDPHDTSYTTEETGALVDQMREIAQEVSIGLIGSYREKGEENPLNTCIAIGPDGRTLAKYSKIHLFSPAGEDLHYSAGRTLGSCTVNSCTIGLAICYDLRFSQLFQAYRNKGVLLMIVPSAWPSSRMKHFNLFTTSRAAEFQTFVASVNTVGITPVDTYTGGTCIAGPDGTIRARGSDLEELIFYDIHEEEALTMRKKFPVHQDYEKVDYTELLAR